MPSIAASTQAESCVSVKQKAPGQDGGDGLGLSYEHVHAGWGPPRVLIQAECPADVNRTTRARAQGRLVRGARNCAASSEFKISCNCTGTGNQDA
jgi:hypothetical protein